ncbi:hypothetical protein CYA_0210 [Synechococcus sp. JA-3-3Ab]|nr:hypothetical protein CYA_0210 [Synechococcus sp. JA-3-3Ab]
MVEVAHSGRIPAGALRCSLYRRDSLCLLRRIPFWVASWPSAIA